MKTAFLLSFLCISLCAHASPESEDSLKMIVSGNFADTVKVQALQDLSMLTTHRPAALQYAYQASQLAAKTNNKKWEASSYKRLADIYFDANNYPPALENYIKALHLYEKLKDHHAIALLYNSIGNVYSRQDQYETALIYYRRYATAKKALGDDERIAFFGIGKSHEFMEQFDSALSYYQRAYEYLQATPTNPRTPFVLIHLGNVHLKKKNYLLANSYARMAGSYVKYAKDSVGIASIYTHMAEIYVQTDSKDSAIFYAEKAYQISDRVNSLDSKVEPALLLADLYVNDPVKSYFYYKTGKTIEDTMFSRKRLHEMQTISFNETIRQKELLEADEKAKETRRHNIQYAGIGLALAFFCLLFILLSSSIIVNEKHVKFLGILILLMVFEFLNLVLHPYLGELTHHSPVLMLLAMVAIAALLIPTHHRLEHWITKKMVKKNKLVRLTAAKKIVEELEKEVS